ncbi:MAG: AAA family ATPase [Treponema sp.]|nr:AAA family ATPase [Treponema sp.]
MDFAEALRIVTRLVPYIQKNKYDGLIVKQIAETNCVGISETSGQTHFAITGKQMDMFPYIRADGYFAVPYVKGNKLKNYFALNVPLSVYKKNIDYLQGKDSDATEIQQFKVSVIRSRRADDSEQIEFGVERFCIDGDTFINFKKNWHPNDYFILLKYENTFFYDCVVLRESDGLLLKPLVGDFFYLPSSTQTKIDISTDSEINSIPLAIPRNRIIFGAPGTGKSKKLSADFEKYFLTCLNSSDLHKQLYDEIHSQPIDADQAEWITALGIRYATYITEKYINPKKQNELIDDFDLLNNGEQTTKKKEQLVQGAKAAYRLHLNDKLLCYKSRGERVTFHPNYSYAQFVGTYKPVQDSADENQIKYEYIPGPFMRIYTAAKQNPSQNFLLLIEEINRANVAAVFGDVFQLLDRDENGNSEYPVAASEDIKKYLAKNGIHEDELKIPSNMYIWATMNSADQGVFPMDTAFKRRWEFEYIDINKNADKLVDEDNKPILIPIPSKEGKIAYKEIKYDLYKWNDVREKINDKLSEISSVSEDKLLGPFFISLEKLRSAKDDPQEFIGLFKSKVLMYLFEDVVKISPTKLFEKCGDHPRYSKICSKFDEIGCGIFGFELEKQISSESEPSETANE